VKLEALSQPINEEPAAEIAEQVKALAGLLAEHDRQCRAGQRRCYLMCNHLTACYSSSSRLSFSNLASSKSTARPAANFDAMRYAVKDSGDTANDQVSHLMFLKRREHVL